MFDIIAFDADDTLWENEKLYRDAKSRFLDLLSKYQESRSVERLLEEIEVYNIFYYGYGIKSFALSMVEAALESSEGRATGDEISEIIQTIKSMLLNEVELFEHVEETLKSLSEKFILMLITKGDLFEQERKIQRSGLASYFRYIEVVGEKSVQAYKVIFSKYNINPKRVLMVGNSVKSDIMPIIEMGGKAVLIPYENTWFHENVDESELKEVQFDQLEHLGQLTDYINNLR